MKIFCRHNNATIVRWHKECVPNKMKSKMLYVDVHNVWNFVKCTDCGKILYGDLREPIYGVKE